MFLFRSWTGFLGGQRYVGFMIAKRALFEKEIPFGRSKRGWEVNVKKCKYVCVCCDGVFCIHNSQYKDSYKHGTNRWCSFLTSSWTISVSSRMHGIRQKVSISAKR
jgi:hypothetical protein